MYKIGINDTHNSSIAIFNEFFASKNAIRNIEYVYVKDSLFKIKKN